MKLTKAEYDALPAAMKKLFKADGDDYVATFETADDVAALRNANQRNKDELKELKDSLKALKEERQQQDDNDNKRKGDIDAIEKSWQTKLDKAIADKDAIIGKRDAALRQILVKAEAAKLAGEISTTPALLERFIEDRLAADFDGDTPKTRVLGADGKPSALSLDDLKKEFLADTRFSTILVGSKGSGGGAGGTKTGAGGFNVGDYKNADGSVNWGKVNADRATNPEIVEQVQTALMGTAQAQ